MMNQARHSEDVFDVAVIIPTHERPKDLCELLASMERLEGPIKFEVIVIDDGSVKHLEPLVRERSRRFPVRVSRNSKPLGPSVARNQAVKITNAEYLWFLDSDAQIVFPETLTVLVHRLRSCPTTGAVGGVFERFGSHWKPVRLHIWPNFLFVYSVAGSPGPEVSRVDGLGACNIMMRRRDFNILGGFDESYNRDEDVDLCLRLRSQRLAVEQLAFGLVRHCLSSAGRETGQLAHFQTPGQYFHDMLDTRAKLLARHKPLRAIFLPLLDLVFLTLMALNVVLGRYSMNRMSKVAGSSSIQKMRALICELLRSYGAAWRYVVKKPIK